MTEDERKKAIQRLATKCSRYENRQEMEHRVRYYLRKEFVKQEYPDYREDGFTLESLTPLVVDEMLKPTTNDDRINSRFEIMDLSEDDKK
jgi:hypothetical protein